MCMLWIYYILWCLVSSFWGLESTPKEPTKWLLWRVNFRCRSTIIVNLRRPLVWWVKLPTTWERVFAGCFRPNRPILTVLHHSVPSSIGWICSTMPRARGASPAAMNLQTTIQQVCEPAGNDLQRMTPVEEKAIACVLLVTNEIYHTHKH